MKQEISGYLTLCWPTINIKKLPVDCKTFISWQSTKRKYLASMKIESGFCENTWLLWKESVASVILCVSVISGSNASINNHSLWDPCYMLLGSLFS